MRLKRFFVFCLLAVSLVCGRASSQPADPAHWAAIDAARTTNAAPSSVAGICVAMTESGSGPTDPGVSCACSELYHAQIILRASAIVADADGYAQQRDFSGRVQKYASALAHRPFEMSMLAEPLDRLASMHASLQQLQGQTTVHARCQIWLADEAKARVATPKPAVAGPHAFAVPPPALLVSRMPSQDDRIRDLVYEQAQADARSLMTLVFVRAELRVDDLEFGVLDLDKDTPMLNQWHTLVDSEQRTIAQLQGTGPSTPGLSRAIEDFYDRGFPQCVAYTTFAHQTFATQAAQLPALQKAFLADRAAALTTLHKEMQLWGQLAQRDGFPRSLQGGRPLDFSFDSFETVVLKGDPRDPALPGTTMLNRRYSWNIRRQSLIGTVVQWNICNGVERRIPANYTTAQLPVGMSGHEGNGILYGAVYPLERPLEANSFYASGAGDGQHP
jgi:hypothetical protein